MNLSEFLDGTVAEKAYFAPVFGAVECAGLECLSLEVSGRPLPAVAFAQIASSVNSANTNEANNTGAGVGSLTIPANYFVDGSTGTLEMSGVVSAVGGETLTLRLYAGVGGFVQIGSVAIVVPASTAKGFTAKFGFIVRADGIAGVASMSTAGQYQQGRNADLVRSAGDGYTLNVTTFATTVVNQFALTSQWSAATASITVQNLVLTV